MRMPIISIFIAIFWPDFCHLVRWLGAQPDERILGVGGDWVGGDDGLSAGHER